jgi:hypothetical protein
VIPSEILGVTIQIVGNTVDGNGVPLAASLYVDLKTIIKLASFDVYYSEDGGLTYTEASQYGITPFKPVYSGYLIPSGGMEFVKVKNTGNVELQLKVL